VLDRARPWLTMALAAALLAFLGLAGAPAARADLLFAVNSTGDAPDANVGDQICDSRPLVAGDQCTLRAVIQETNTDPGTDGIHFDIPGPGVKSITPHTALPTITGPVDLDGYTQGASSPNTNPFGQPDNATLLVELDGEKMNPALPALTVGAGADESVIEGLVINRFKEAGLELDADATVQGNFIGTSPGGKVAEANGDGVVANANSQIGGLTRAARNLISGNNEGVVALNGPATVEGNYIGTQRDGTSALGNTHDGILLFTSFNTVGAVGGGNVIAFNQSGVAVEHANGHNPILRNRIFSNSFIGIDLGRDGRTRNDPGDTDGVQNTPAITGATRAPGGTVTVTGRLLSAPSQQFTLELFANPPGGDQGATFIGEKVVTTDSSGLAAFTFQPSHSIAVGNTITATATMAPITTQSTSEFSRPHKVVSG
jgi:uncharacterized membrane protein YtjA (UPF0391 family)